MVGLTVLPRADRIVFEVMVSEAGVMESPSTRMTGEGGGRGGRDRRGRTVGRAGITLT